MNVNYDKYKRDLEAKILNWNINGFWELQSDFVWNLKKGHCSFCSKVYSLHIGGKGFTCQACENHREECEKMSSIHNQVLNKKIKEKNMDNGNKKAERINVGAMFKNNVKEAPIEVTLTEENKAKNSNKNTSINNGNNEVLKTQEIRLRNITLSSAQNGVGKGVKRNVYFDKKSWEIVMKVKEKKGYASVSKTIQAIIKAIKA